MTEEAELGVKFWVMSIRTSTNSRTIDYFECQCGNGRFVHFFLLNFVMDTLESLKGVLSDDAVGE
jgi:hypothetical protein